jgi:hypothetical protein
VCVGGGGGCLGVGSACVCGRGAAVTSGGALCGARRAHAVATPRATLHATHDTRTHAHTHAHTHTHTHTHSGLIARTFWRVCDNVAPHAVRLNLAPARAPRAALRPRSSHPLACRAHVAPRRQRRHTRARTPRHEVRRAAGDGARRRHTRGMKARGHRPSCTTRACRQPYAAPPPPLPAPLGRVGVHAPRLHPSHPPTPRTHPPTQHTVPARAKLAQHAARSRPPGGSSTHCPPPMCVSTMKRSAYSTLLS